MKTMWSCRQLWILAVAAALAGACLGCGDEDTPSDPGGSVEAPLPPPTIPKVFLTEEQRESCVVRDGDTMPDAELSDLEGKLQPVSGLRGQKLTVVCLWKSGETEEGRLRSLEILGDLQDLSDPYLKKGVRVIGINEGDPPEVVRLCIDGAEAAFPILLDPDGAFFEKVATETLPRIYLLDAEGEILWFDLEFSLTTRRNLKKGIQVALGEI
jgi:peroxiredoxin